VIGLQLVDKPELHAVADAEAPVDRVIRRAGVPVDELPARVLGRGDPIDVDRVVFPLDPTKRFVVGRVLMTTVPVAVVMTVAVAFAGDRRVRCRDECRRQRLHAAARAAAWIVADDVGCIGQV
jgi:hypothetical protein